MAKLAINGGTPVRHKPWPQWPVRDEREKAYLLKAFEESQWGGFPEPQPMAQELAEKFAAAHDAKYGVCCANGSISLEIALRAGGIHAGDEVIVPATTWIATGACAVFVNAVPVFVDVSKTNFCMDPDAVEAAITPKTRAIIPVHLGSSIADLDRLTEIARKHNLLLIEDCAHAHGSKWRDKGVGSWGDIASFSFQSSKILTSGEGGMLLTNDEMLAKRMHSLVNCGRQEPGYENLDEWLFGYNARMSEFQTAVMLGQLERMPELNARKAENVEYFTKRLEEVEGLDPVPTDPRETARGIYQFIMTYDSNAFEGVHRDRFLEALEAEGVEMSGVFYPPMPQNPLFHAWTRDWPMLRERYGDGIPSPEAQKQLSFPVAESFAKDTGCWLHYPYLMGDKSDVDDIVEAIIKVKENLGELK